MAKAADLRKFQVNTGATSPASAPDSSQPQLDQDTPYIKKGLQLRPEANQQFEILKAELGTSGKKLMAEALNLLFKKHGKPEVA